MAPNRVGLDEEPAVYYSRPEREHFWDRLFMGVFGVRLPLSERGWLRYEWSLSLLQ